MKRILSRIQFHSSASPFGQFLIFKRFSEEQKKPKVVAAPTSAYASIDKLQPSHFALKGNLIL